MGEPPAPERDANGFGFTEYAPLRQVLMHSPGEEIDRITPSAYRRYLFEDAVEPSRFRAQHEALVDTLRGEGVKVRLIGELLRGSPVHDQISRCPNLIYTRDTIVVTRRGPIFMKMRSPVRGREPALAAAALARLGLRPLLRIRAPGTLEGGDAIFLDDETLLLGIGNRTNGAGMRQLRVGGAGEGLRTVMAIRLPRWAIHLDGTMMIVDRDLAIVHRDSLLAPSTIYEAGKPPRPARPLEFLARRGLRTIAVTAYERQRRATNVITLGPRRLVGYAGHARVRRELLKEGADLIEVDGSELVRGGGGPRCMTAPIDRGSVGRIEIPDRTKKEAS